MKRAGNIRRWILWIGFGGGGGLSCSHMLARFYGIPFGAGVLATVMLALLLISLFGGKTYQQGKGRVAK